jgi:hypothetical protein
MLRVQLNIRNNIWVAGEKKVYGKVYEFIKRSSIMFHVTSISMIKNESIQHLERTIELSWNIDSLSGWVYQDIKPWALADIAVNVRHFKIADRVGGFVTHCHLAVSFIHKGETLSVLEAANNTDSTHYTEEDITILEKPCRKRLPYGTLV